MSFQRIAQQLAHPSGEFGLQVGNAMNVLNEFINLQAYKWIDVEEGDRILEIGMGNGKYVAALLGTTNFASYYGVDVSSLMISEARKNNHHLVDSGKVEFGLAEIESLPFGDRMFDKACTINTIYFWKDTMKAIHEVARVLKDKGIFVLAFRPFVEGKTLDFTEYGFKEFCTNDVEVYIQKSAFEIVNIETIEEEPVEFNGKHHELESVFYVLQKSE